MCESDILGAVKENWGGQPPAFSSRSSWSLVLKSK